jgi:hypothetical protein
VNAVVTRRALELATGAVTAVFGVAVIASSIEVGSGWSTAGVESGTFPLLAGVLILGGSLWNLARAAASYRGTVVESPQLLRLARLFLPAAAFVAVIPLAGFYAAAGAYLVYALSVQHRLRLWRTAAIVLATELILYWIFERTFDVMMPRGWLGALLGF